MKNTTHKIFRSIRARILSGLLVMVLFSLSLAGCGAKQEAEGPEPGTAPTAGGADTYIAEAYPLPQEHITNAAVYQNTLYYVNQESSGENVAQQSIYRLDMAAEAGEPTAVPLTLEEGVAVLSMKVDETEKLHLLTLRFDESNALSEFTWLKSDESGNLTGSVSLFSFYQEHGSQYPTAFEVDGAGNIYLAMGTTVYGLDAEGNLLFEVACDNAITQLSRDTAGKIYAVWYSMAEESLLSTQMAEIDSASQSLGARYAPAVADIVLGAGTGTEGKMLLASTGGVYEYEMESNTTTEKFKWASLDVVSDYSGLFCPLADGRFLWIGRKAQDDTLISNLTVVRVRKEGEVAAEPKEILTFGGLSLFIDASIREGIVNFNQTNPDYRIELKEYASEDMMAGLEQLNNDIITGQAPDIMVLPMGASMSAYADKGVLEDLNPYMEGDGTVNRADLQENVLDAFELDGKLYGMPISYIIYSMVGRTAVVGEEAGWTLDELNALVDQIGDEKQVFAMYDKITILNMCMEANRNAIINRDNPEQGFDRETFMKILEFANRFAPDDPTVTEDPLVMFDRISNGETHILETAIPNVASHQLYSGLFGEPITYMGYPSENSSGLLAGSLALIAINGQCPNKEAAWQFISSMLSADFQENTVMAMGIPIRKSGLDKLLEQAMVATYTTDENGNQQEVPLVSAPVGSTVIDIYAAKEEDVQALRKVIESIDTAQESDSQITAIISEEAPAYFNGSKSAEEVTEIVENRIQLYLDEIS